MAEGKPVPFITTLLHYFQFLLVNMESENAMQIKSRLTEYFHTHIRRCQKTHLYNVVKTVIVSYNLQPRHAIIIPSIERLHFRAAEK